MQQLQQETPQLETRRREAQSELQRIERELAAGQARRTTLEQLQARMMLEGEVAGLAAENVTPEQLAALDASLVAMEGMINDRTRFLEEDQRFHMAVVVASGSQTLIDLVEFLWKQRTLPVYRAFEKHFTGAAEQAAVLEEHRAIVEAIRQHDSRKARSAMRKHIDRVRKQFTK